MYFLDLKEWSDLSQTLNINLGQERFRYYDPLEKQVWLADDPVRFTREGGRLYREWPDHKAWNGIRDGVNTHIRGTEHQPVYQNFVLGLERLHIDVPDGEYAVTLHVCEPFSSTVRSDSQRAHGADENGTRCFSAEVQGVMVFDALDLAKQVGPSTALSKTVEISVSGGKGCACSFVAKNGESMVSGISLRPIRFS